MSEKIEDDLIDMTKKLTRYVNEGRITGFTEVTEEPSIAIRPDRSKVRALEKMSYCDVHFWAVDCSTRTIKRANNWGIYILRTSYAWVRGRDVDWGYEERMCTVIGEAYVRRRYLQAMRLDLESKMALDLLQKASRGDYLLLDGASYFGGERKFWVSLYEKCEKTGIKLLAISKQSPTLLDDRGRDFMAAVGMLSSFPIWFYFPVVEANIHEHRYGNVSVVKLCAGSSRVFRCDIMEYLKDCDVHELLSPLTFLSEDPRCLGYPVTLWLAHDFSTSSDSKLLYYHDQVEEKLREVGLLDVLHREELSCNFPDELHGIKHPFEMELIDRV